MVASFSWRRTSSVLLASLPLVLLFVATSHGGKSGTTATSSNDSQQDQSVAELARPRRLFEAWNDAPADLDFPGGGTRKGAPVETDLEEDLSLGGSDENESDEVEHFEPDDILKMLMGNKDRSDAKTSGGGGKKKIPERLTDCSPNSAPQPANGETKCQRRGGCLATCNRRYRYPNGKRTLRLQCQNGEWTLRDGVYETLPDCEPRCRPPCQNNGICISPNHCLCPDNWEGDKCQISKTPLPVCSNQPPTPRNSRIVCSSQYCTARCQDGYQFEDGVNRLTFKCVNGSWTIRKPGWTDIAPDCQPICDPVCENGGECIGPDLCQCTSSYRGNICQYPISNCDPKKLTFNGQYNCSGKGMVFGCSLDCPVGVNFESPPADIYNCDFTTGTWSPSPIPQCDYSTLLTTTIPVTVTANPQPSFKKQPGVCFTWSGTHYKSFDDKVYSFESPCPFTLVQDSAHGTFSVNIRSPEGCEGSFCPKIIEIFYDNEKYILQLTKSGHPSLSYKDTNLAIPGQLNGLISERMAHFVVVKLWGLGITLKWDLKSLVVMEISEVLWNKTSGLCGRRDGIPDNDWSYADGTTETNMNAFLQAWQATNFGEQCLQQPKTKHPCIDNPEDSDAEDFCAHLRSDPRFSSCRQVVDVEPYVNACRWDYCDHGSRDPVVRGCESYSAFFRDCSSAGVDIPGGWRSPDLCPMECGTGKVYNPCMSAIQPRCGQPTANVRPDFCVEGCDCPEGLVLHRGLCIPTKDCPCTHHNKEYSPGETMFKDCKECKCGGGEWECKNVKCKSRCTASGDPHYRTFDGRAYDFMGKCSYYMVQTQNVSIQAENVPCYGGFQKGRKYPVAQLRKFPSCTRSVTVRVKGTVIHLKQGKQITINGVEITKLPVPIDDVYIKAASSAFIAVELKNYGLEVWWDGVYNVHIDAMARMRGLTAGLCGTFNDNQRDDFLTPEGDIEQNPIAFANKWKTSGKCLDEPLNEASRPCDRHLQRKSEAEQYCTKLKSPLFAQCNVEVDPEPYYRNCMYDMCSCEADLDNCLCPSVSAYGNACSLRGILVDWRAEIRECGIQCTGGQKYHVCGNSCSRTCLDLALNPDCANVCVEGCNCPEGFSLNGDDVCVPVSDCPCVYEAKTFKAGHKMMQQKGGSYQVCECYNAAWVCREPHNNETEIVPQEVECREESYEVYTECLPEDENTCQTMYLHPAASDPCQPGCVCAEGYVRDAATRTCIHKKLCPCRHGGIPYEDGAVITEDCNTCTCEGGLWQCTKKECPGICTAWGESHYKTFDGRLFEFHGTCDYLLAKGSISKTDTFEVIIQNVPCGTDGITCAKSITLRVGSGDSLETIEFSRNKPTPSTGMTRTVIREAGVFVFAEVTDMGLVLQWDRGTRAYLRLDPMWQGKVQGLCGNYNGDEQDDFQTPSRGSSEASVKIFGDSWRLQNYCPESTLIQDTCGLHPHRKGWASEQCDILKSEIFATCHSEVPVEPYRERCEYDACACNTGGDCHCLCTAVAAYAHECTIHGVYVKWRKPDFCPMQCDEKCEYYEPCIPTCPQMSCETLFDPSPPLCAHDACVEGCASEVCPPGQVYKNASKLVCVPKADCVMKCLEIDGKVYMEGDIISEDECHTCFCSRKKKICRGTPCTTPTAATPYFSLTPSVIVPSSSPGTMVTVPSSSPGAVVTVSPSSTGPWVTESPSSPSPWVTTPSTSSWVTTPASSTEEVMVVECRDGWTDWINEDKPIILTKNSDVEKVPERIRMSTNNTGFCARSQIAAIKCRSVGNHRPHTEQYGVTCNLKDGLLCQGRRDATGDDVCRDYEVAFLCDCKCRPTQIHKVNAVLCVHVCHSHRYFLQQSGICMHDTQYAPACVGLHSNIACPGNQYLRDKTTCVAIQDCNCYHPSGVYIPPGQTRRVGECEICHCDNNILKCDSSLCIPTISTLKTTPKPTFECDKWSPWLSEGTPTSGNEFELMYDLRSKYPELCTIPQDIECRVKGSHESADAVGQVVKCNRRHGFECLRSQNPQGCKDYEIRVWCSCSEITESTTEEIGYTCPPGTTHEDCALPCDSICMYHLSILRRWYGECLLDDTCAPGCVKKNAKTTCSQGFFMIDQGRCVTVDQCSCVRADGKPLLAGESYDVSRCERCTCQNNSIQCNLLEGCEGNATESSAVTASILTTKYTPSIQWCNDWSPFYKNEEKDSDGVMVSLDMLRIQKDFVCENPTNATCREVVTKTSAADLGQNLICNAMDGLRCLNQENEKDCYDYEISFFCACEETTPVSSITVTLGPTTTVAPCDAWSPWINNNKPWQADGDIELRTLQQLQDDYQFCLEGYLADIECVKATTGLIKAADTGIMCDVQKGFRCVNADQIQGSCHDYKIRYYCSCRTTVVTTTVIIPVFSTPAPVCDPDRYINLLEEVKDSAFSSTPARNSAFGPPNAKLYDEDGSLTSGSWAPATNDRNQFVQVDLGSVVPVYGVEVAGNPLSKERVTAFTIQFSEDSHLWSVIPQDLENATGPPKIFRGPINSAEPLKQLFSKPIEMQYLRLKPTEWFQAIALRFEVIGCSLPSVTPQPSETTTITPICKEPMGLEGGMMSDHQIMVSSVLKDQKDFYGKENIRLNSKSTPSVSAGAWVAEPKLNQFVRFDFLKPSKLSGVITQGRDSVDEWVESFTVHYSPDGQTWNTIKNPDDTDKVFHGNFDRSTPVNNMFDRLIQARFLEIRPKTWKSNIAMRVEVIGCFHPYPVMTTTLAPVLTTEPPPRNCSVCPGLPDDYYDNCMPCLHGEYFDGRSCVTKGMCPCFKDGIRYQAESVFETRDCKECHCLAGGDTLCIEKKCPQCEDDQQAILTPSCACICKSCPEGTKLCPSSNYCLNESSWCNGVEECSEDELNCVTMTQGPVINVTTAAPPGLPRNLTAVCKLEGQSFTSFDDSTYELDLCHHILAEDKINKDWIVSVHTRCVKNKICGRFLNITRGRKQLLLHQDLSISWNGNSYTVAQAQRIGSSTKSFTISQAGNSIYFESKHPTFSVRWTMEMNVMITLGNDFIKKVDGLCGFYTGNMHDDKTKPDGTLASSIKEFGQSWALDGKTCDEKPKCKPESTNKAYKLCSTIQLDPLSACHSTVNPASYMKQCIDTMCRCFLSGDSDEECRCQILTDYVTQCLEKNPEAPVSDWRIVTKCYKECGQGETYHDCFRAKCEKSCETMQSENQCSDERGSCSPGCFCNPGLVRKGGRCVVPDRCRDCVCEGYGDPHFVTFDRYNFTFNGECSYVAAQDWNPQSQHKFQVIIHNKQCTSEPVTVCTDGIIILFDSHEVVILAVGDTIGVTVENDRVINFPHRESWLNVEQPDPSQVMVTISDIQLEVTFFLENFGFSIRIPSHLYFNKTEGLCGNCNYNDKDDLNAKSIGLVDSVDTFGLSWLLENEPKTCGVLKKEGPCVPLPPDQDPCAAIMNEDIFGKCHPVEDPAAYVSSCQLDACHSDEPLVSACHSIEAYARRCADLDICLDWRSEELCPKTCSGGQEYHACVSGCVHTCDNYEELKTNPDACPMSSVDGCFCPDGMVLDKGTCMNASFCKTCDIEGHHIGDVWQTDACTSCKCTDTGIACNTTSCSVDPICGDGFILVEVPGSENICSGPKKKCEVAPLEYCPPVEQKGECGYGQQMKLIKAPGICPQYACICLEPEDCPDPAIPKDEDLEPGEEWTLDDSGCCAIYTKECPEECPKVACPTFYVPREEMLKEGDCCPKTKCDPPADACVYEHKYRFSAFGTEELVSSPDAAEKRLYKVDESWQDGFCLTCKCFIDDKGLVQHECIQQTCLTPDDHPDSGLFQLETVKSPGHCCAEIVRTACIDNNRLIEVGEHLNDTLNGCRSVECIKNPKGKVDKVEKVLSCDETCPAGWEYEPSPLYPQQCCGNCVQVACIVAGQVKAIDETWMSDDLCTTYACSRDEHVSYLKIYPVNILT
ncbi:hemocytin-like isoform X2 [Panulirus ornatus]|uniref:hemocytin-like isoform X2 n=1 Tax=Panulirus ornatus TaxID=150431 RepID=UPI003A8B23CB